MNWFIFMPIWCGIVALYSNVVKVRRRELVLGRDVERVTVPYAIVAFLPIFFLASLGDPVSDTVAYIKNFNTLSTDLFEIHYDESGWGFQIFSVIIKYIFGNKIVFRLAIALVHSLPVILMFRKYSESYAVSLFLFVASSVYLSWMMNGLRQFMAVAIIFAATPLLLKRKYFKLFLIILLACTIHQSAIIMFPIVLIVQGKPFNKLTMLFIFAAVIAMWAFSEYTDLFEMAVDNTEYGAGYDEIKEVDDGSNPIRTLIYAVPAALAFLNRKELINENNKFYNICVNMSIITFGISLLSTVTSGILVGRLVIYTSLFNFILLPKLLNDIEDKRIRHLVYIIMIAAYIFFYKTELGKFWYYNINIFGGLS